VSSSVVPRRSGGLTRADKARLFEAGFQDIVDQHGKKPSEIAIAAPAEIDMTLETKDTLNTYEIIFQFLAYSHLQVINPILGKYS
jgi:nephrocystin-4